MEITKRSFISFSLKGVNKKDNEDNYLAIENDRYDLFAIFDGVGSAKNSKQATILAKEYLEANHSIYITKDVRLDELMYDCNNYILNKDLAESLTTYCTIIFLKSQSSKIYYSYMGDSRMYIISNKFIEQITQDDKLATANILTRCLGMNTLERYDFNQNSLTITEENILLCTDGFYQFLENERMHFFEIFNKKNLHSIKDTLIEIVQNRNNDDATCVLIR